MVMFFLSLPAHSVINSATEISSEEMYPMSIAIPIRALVKDLAVDHDVAILSLFELFAYCSATITPCLITTTP